MSHHPRDRAHRRVHRARVIHHRCRSISWLASYLSSNSEMVDPRAKAAARSAIAKTAVRCSCWMCGNPRRKTGETTLAEKRSAQTLKEALRAP